MDRARLVTALALVFSMFSVILGIANIGVRSSDSPFVSDTESFLSSGTAGIALIEVHGAIRNGYGSNGADSIVKLLDAAKTNSSVRGILLDVNSPGGAVGATKKIYDKVMDVRLVKPVVAVVTDVAASGGYYVASAADQIFAYEGSILGSIGVIMLRPDVSDFLASYGVRIEPITAGRFKDMSYPFRRLTDEERRMYDDMIEAAYQQFLEDVSKGRKQGKDTVEKWAEGRVFSGKYAKSQQIIDDIGGRAEAVAAIKIMLKTNEDLPLLEPPRTFFEELFFSYDASFGSRGGGAGARYEDLLSAPVLYLYPDGAGMLLDLLEVSAVGAKR